MQDRIRTVIVDLPLLGAAGPRISPPMAAALEALRDENRRIGIHTTVPDLTGLLPTGIFSPDACCTHELRANEFDTSCALVVPPEASASTMDAGANLVIIDPAPTPTAIDHVPSFAIARITSPDGLRPALHAIESINTLCARGNRSFERRQYRKAATNFHQAAEASLAIGDAARASALFARAGIAQEHTETWRSTSLSWYRAARCLDADAPPFSVHVEYDLTEHHYPSISFAQWDAIPLDERRARAYRYAGYHAQNTNSPQDAYLFYLSAARHLHQHRDKAAEVLVDACLSFIKEYGDLAPEYVRELHDSIETLPITQPDAGALYLRQIAQALRAKGNSELAEQLVVAACRRDTKNLRRQRRFAGYLLYVIWDITSAFGTSLLRWTVWTTALVLLVFPSLLALTHALPQATPAEHLYWSLMAFTTTGLPNTITPIGKLVFCLEILTGYTFLAILATLLLKKVLH